MWVLSTFYSEVSERSWQMMICFDQVEKAHFRPALAQDFGPGVVAHDVISRVDFQRLQGLQLGEDDRESTII